MYNNHDTADTKHYAMVQEQNIRYFARKERKAQINESLAKCAGAVMIGALGGAIAYFVWPLVEFVAYTLGIFPGMLP